MSNDAHVMIPIWLYMKSAMLRNTVGSIVLSALVLYQTILRKPIRFILWHVTLKQQYAVKIMRQYALLIISVLVIKGVLTSFAGLDKRAREYQQNQ